MSKLDLQELEAYMSGYWLSDLANFSSYLFANVSDLNWVGFYLNDGKTLRLGPFHGSPACFEIGYGKGVCGTSFTKKEPLIVPDVDQFPGHIVCDTKSRSEMVLPFFVGDTCVGVLDLDSPKLARFNQSDMEIVARALKILSIKLSESTNSEFGILKI